MIHMIQAEGKLTENKLHDECCNQNVPVQQLNQKRVAILASVNAVHIALRRKLLRFLRRNNWTEGKRQDSSRAEARDWGAQQTSRN